VSGKALILTLKEPPPKRLDLSPLSRIGGKSLEEIPKIQLWMGREKLLLEEIFAVEGEVANRIVLKGGSGKLDFLGAGAEGMAFQVEGDLGDYVALQARDCEIAVKGSVGHFAAAEMDGGTLVVEGNAGDFVASALPGSRQGMRRGLVLIRGSGGDRLGDRLRSGNLLVEGGVGDFCASRVIAGTVAVMGEVGKLPGYGLRRGTLLLWREPSSLPPTFGDCGTVTLLYLQLWFESWQKMGLPGRFADPSCAFTRVRKWGGDLAAVGHGEILLRAV